jgi:hypothetical protein
VTSLLSKRQSSPRPERAASLAVRPCLEELSARNLPSVGVGPGNWLPPAGPDPTVLAQPPAAHLPRAEVVNADGGDDSGAVQEVIDPGPPDGGIVDDGGGAGGGVVLVGQFVTADATLVAFEDPIYLSGQTFFLDGNRLDEWHFVSDDTFAAAVLVYPDGSADRLA